MGRYLICTASIGSGHIKAAEAIRAELKKSQPDAIIKVVDFMTPEVSRLNYFFKQLYLKMLAFVPFNKATFNN